MRDQGAATVLYDLNFNKRVGTTAKPADPATMAAKAKSLYDYAVSVTGCRTPMIAENELFGAQTPTPWSDTNAQYRANVLAFLTGAVRSSARGRCSRSRTRRSRVATRPTGGGRSRRWRSSCGRSTSPRRTRRRSRRWGRPPRAGRCAAGTARARQQADADRHPVRARRAAAAVQLVARASARAPGSSRPRRGSRS